MIIESDRNEVVERRCKNVEVFNHIEKKHLKVGEVGYESACEQNVVL